MESEVREEKMLLRGRTHLENAIIEELKKKTDSGSDEPIDVGVTSFKGRTRDVNPEAGDYTAAQVGALALTGGTVTGDVSFKTKVSEGLANATGVNSHAEGGVSGGDSSSGANVPYNPPLASGADSHAEGSGTIASGHRSHAEGSHTYALGPIASTHGYWTIGYSGEFVVGRGNVDTNGSTSATLTSNLLIVGNGTASSGTISNRSNIFRVERFAIYGAAAFNSTGADYAEMFEWEDLNLNGEDRVGRFVTLDGTKIRLATGDDDFILGIVSASPSVVGDVHEDQWRGMYERDIFERIVIEEAIRATDEEAIQAKINSKYDDSQIYVGRSKRPDAP